MNVALLWPNEILVITQTNADGFDDVAKDDFASIKNTSRDDILAAHRVPPQLLGMIPFGDVEKAKQVFVENESAPIQTKMIGLNALLGVEAFFFRDTLMTTQA